ncbi:hypothetical protein IFR05_012221 [Cadophora sp. M221]|nr:hypothetical protein IFR05_012221 [Cadophora sp. M221]
MMISPEDPRWSDVEDPNSEGLFSHKTATLYSEARKDIEEVLDNIQKSLNKVSPKDTDKHTTRRQWNRLLFAIKQDQLELQLAKAETYNRFLVNLTRENVMSSVPEPSRRTAKHYNTIREHAIMMAEALQRKLLGEQCHCKAKHSASLVLEVRSNNGRAKSCYFHVLFGSEAASASQVTWEAEIQACEKSTPRKFLSQLPGSTSTTIPTITVAVASNSDISEPCRGSGDQWAKKKRSIRSILRSRSLRSESSDVRDKRDDKKGGSGLKSAAITTTVTSSDVNPRRNHNVGFEIPDDENRDMMAEEIENLCATIATTQWESGGYGVLTTRGERWQKISRATKPCCSSKNIKMVSLAQILSAGLWDSKPKSKLGLKLASAVLQLYQTAWLGDNWGKEDIFFIQEEDGTIITDKPFIRPQLIFATSHPKSATINTNVPCLFALGVVLLELHYKKAIDELEKEQIDFTASSSESPEISSLKRASLIWRLIEQMKAGDNIEKVLKRCIKGLDGAWTDINKEELRDMVEEKIIVPLENEVLWLHGCNKIEQCI